MLGQWREQWTLKEWLALLGNETSDREIGGELREATLNGYPLGRELVTRLEATLGQRLHRGKSGSPLVYLAGLDDFFLLRTLFSEVAIPLGVFQEVAIGGTQFPVARQVIAAQGNWLHTPRLRDDSRAVEFRNAGLHSGESEALALALELQTEALLMDDSDAVEIARQLGINVIRTTGIYRLAKQRGLIESLAPKLDQLRSAGFWLRDDHYRMILNSVGEG